SSFVFLTIRRPPRSTLFPYTTLSDLRPHNPHDQACHGGLRLHRGGRGVGRLCAGQPPVGRRTAYSVPAGGGAARPQPVDPPADRDRKSTRLNSSHVKISYAVFCLKKK